MAFPDGFAWGAAAASYQVEGGAFEDGKGPSVWDVFCRRPGAVFEGHTGDVSCDHYHRWRQDVDLMRRIGLRAYRLSLSWPRILPAGTGAVNEKGLAFYDRLIDALLEANIQPWVTLFHWDYPQALYERGGWLNRDSAEWFAEYAAVVADRLGDRVTRWMTLNEPQCFIGLGHQSGSHAPGVRLQLGEVVRAAHHSLLAHGRATQVLRARCRKPGQVGFAPATAVKMPATDSPADVQAARRDMFRVSNTGMFNNAWWMDPVILGSYPEDGLALFGADGPPVQAGDMETIAQPMDFFGCNIYHGWYVRAGAEGEPVPVSLPPGYTMTTQTHWAVTPDCLYWGPKLFHERYGLPIVITENGHQNTDGVMLDGRVHDPQRIDYLQRYLLELERAIDGGTPVVGYFCWTLMDNFEWALGYGIRVGLVHVDYQTLKRTPKDSAGWYKRVIATNGQALHEAPGAASLWSL